MFQIDEIDKEKWSPRGDKWFENRLTVRRL